MARHWHTGRAPDVEGESSAHLDRSSHIGDWGTRWDAPNSTGVRFEPCDPTEVYAHPTSWSDEVEEARVPAAHARHRSAWSRGIVSLMWAGAIAIAAVQHAGEIDRRANAQEPSAAEFAMQERSGVRITAAWRDLGDRNAIAPSALQRQETEPLVERNSGAEPMTLAEPLKEAWPRQDVALTAPQTQEPDEQGKSDGHTDMTATASREAITETKEAAEPQTAIPRAASTSRTTAERTATLDVSGEQAQNDSQTQLNPTALRLERPVETPRPPRRWTRKSRAKAAPPIELEVAYVIVTPGQFVLSRYFTVYGLNGRTP